MPAVISVKKIRAGRTLFSREKQCLHPGDPSFRVLSFPNFTQGESPSQPRTGTRVGLRKWYAGRPQGRCSHRLFS